MHRLVSFVLYNAIMKFLRTIVFASFLCATGLLASTLTNHPAAEAKARQHLPRPIARQLVPAPTTAKPALWRVSDADTTIYLFGTVHALPKDIQWLDGPVATAFDGSQELVTEILDDEPSQIQSVIAKRAMLANGQNLRLQMPPRMRRSFEATLKSQAIPITTMDQFKPWFAAVFLTTQKLHGDGFDPEYGVEKVLKNRSLSLSQRHTALETFDYQLSLFDSLPRATQMQYLTEVMKQLPTKRNELASMIQAWEKGDADQLAKLLNDEEDDPAMIRLLLTNRNQNWAKWVEHRLDQPGVVFVAVGAGHLAGKDSVQSLLQSKGITSVRVQ